jgi:capsular exopolysaccharide synthesis family protein
MSKYFDQTQPRLESDILENIQLGTVDKFLDTIQDVTQTKAKLAQARFEDCRKLKLRHDANPLLISHVNHCNRSAAESYRGLRTRLIRLQSASGFRSVVVTSAIQGDGKTVTSLNIAISLSQLPQCRTLVVDTDLRTGGLSKLLDLPKGPGLVDVLQGERSYAKTICSTDLPNLYVMGVGSEVAAPVELLAAPALHEFIAWASECFGMIILDAPPLTGITDCELVTSVCDTALIVVRALHTERELLQAAVSHIEAKKIIGFVYNDTEEQSSYGSYPHSIPARRGS